MPDQIQSFKVVSSGGLNSNENHINLSDQEPGSATRLINYTAAIAGSMGLQNMMLIMVK